MGIARAWGVAAAIAIALVGCGGGGGSDPTPAPPATPTSVTLTGTAAKGAALGAATVTVKCATGTGSATTGADGKYTLTLPGASLPCALKVVGTEGSVFHSVVAGTGNTGSYASNLTPLTELLLAKVANAAPATFYAGFGSGSVVSANAVTDAITYLTTALAGVTDLTGVNPVADPLAVGNPLDLKLDALAKALAAAGTTLSEVAASIAANPAAPNVVSAPLAPVATDCAWLKSGKYRMINPNESDPKWRAHVLSVDAVTKTVKDQDGVTASFISNGGCKFTLADAQEINTILVSSGGVLLVHTQSVITGARSVTVGLPEQTLPVSDFAGVWNLAGWDPASGITTPGYVAQNDEITIDANGLITANKECAGLAACLNKPGPFPHVGVNVVAGGFNVLDPANVSFGRAFLYKTLAGKAVFVIIADDGQLIVGSRAEPAVLPTVGTAANFYQFQLDGNGTISALTEDKITFTGVDAAAKTVTRVLTSTNRLDTLTYDKPRNGLRYRALNACSIASAPISCREFVQLPLQGLGITLTLSVGITSPATAFYQVTVNKPS